MNDLSIIQEYMLCAVSDKGTISGAGTEKLLGFVAAGIFELQLAGCVAIDGEAVETSGELPEKLGYLRPMFDFIALKQPIELDAVVDAYNMSITGKRFAELKASVGMSLVEKGLASERRTGLLGGMGYVPEREAVLAVAGRLRAELLGGGDVSANDAVLVILLDRAGCLKRYFSAFECHDIRKKLYELSRSDSAVMVRSMIAHLESLLASISISAIFTASM
ncbi:MAG TPA: GPP34 family phosphoprotein [Firmicutes bacterium]|nr:GPP34 family phosphoprotein [Bacillota bacterium]